MALMFGQKSFTKFNHRSEKDLIMTLKATLLLTGALLFLSVSPVLAETESAYPAKDAKPEKETMFEKQDANKDGAVSQDEFLAYATSKFKEIDANGDGNISEEESKAHREKKKEKWADKREEMKEKREEKKGEMKDKMKEKMKEKSSTEETAPATTP
jgi:hypothetical protein